jgi:hypothetical protein
MPELSAAATLDLWETGEELGPVERCLALIATADPASEGLHDLARLPLGRRDARLLRLHTALAGPILEGTAACPSCGEQAEFAVDASTLLEQDVTAVDAVPVEADGFRVVWRSPDSRDVVAAAATGDAAAAERVLIERCVTAATGPSGDAEATTLPEAVRDTVARAMAAADPLAEVLVTIACPACETDFVADVDVGAFVWAEVRARARRLVHEVDVLARVYGWTETEVFALGERRRASYLRLAAEGRS